MEQGKTELFSGLQLDEQQCSWAPSKPLHQEPGKKSGKPGQVWFNQTYQAFVKKTSLVKSLVRLVLPGF